MKQKIMSREVPSPEEMAENQKYRILSDAKFLKEDADYIPDEKGNLQLHASLESIERTKQEMEAETQLKEIIKKYNELPNKEQQISDSFYYKEIMQKWLDNIYEKLQKGEIRSYDLDPFTHSLGDYININQNIAFQSLETSGEKAVKRISELERLGQSEFQKEEQLIKHNSRYSRKLGKVRNQLRIDKII